MRIQSWLTLVSLGSLLTLTACGDKADDDTAAEADADADYPDAAVDNSRDGAGRKATNKRQPELSAPVGDSGDERKAKRVGGFDLDGRNSFSIPAEKSTTERFAIDGGSYLGKTNFSKTNVSRGNAEKDNAEKENAG